MQLCVENDKKIYDITQMCTDISLKDELNNGPAVLEASYIYDGLRLSPGDPIRFTWADESEGLFFGTVFKTEMGEDKTVKIRAYDQLRYGKAKDIITVKAGEDTVASVVQAMCRALNLKAGAMPAVNYKAAANKVHYQKTWLDVIYGMIGDVLLYGGTGDAQTWYRLADVYGQIQLDDLRNLQLPLCIGDGSLATGYSWEKSIDDDFYNIIKISWMDEKSGKAQIIQEADQNAVNKYGNLLHYDHVSGKEVDVAKLQEKAKKLLQLYNREKESIKLSSIGDISVRAGCSIYGSVTDIALNRRVICRKVSHKFLPVHTMELEVIA